MDRFARADRRLIDHQANFLGWWKASMAEVTALRDLREADTEKARDEANSDLHAAEVAKMQQLNTIRGRLLQHSERLLEISRRALADSGRLAEDAEYTYSRLRGWGYAM